MPQVINTNMSSLQAQRYLDRSQSSLHTALERLSSGLRVNSAKDDAAGLAIAEGLTSQIRGYNQAIRNANDGIGMLQTAEGALEEVANMAQRIRELAVQAANGNYTSRERAHLQAEVAELTAEIERITKTVTFNGIQVIGQSASLRFQVGQGATADDGIKVNFVNVASAAGVKSLLKASVRTVSAALSAIRFADAALAKISEIRADFGAKQNRLEATVRNLQNVSANLQDSRSRIMDADFAAETANMTRAQILQQAGTAMLAQANALPQNALSLLR